MKIVEQSIHELFDGNNNSKQKCDYNKIKMDYLRSKEEEKSTIKKIYLYLGYKFKQKLADIKMLKKLY